MVRRNEGVQRATGTNKLMNKHGITAQPISPIPPDNLQRKLAVARPNQDEKLPHIGLVGDTYNNPAVGQQHQWSLLPYRHADSTRWRPRSAPSRLRRVIYSSRKRERS